MKTVFFGQVLVSIHAHRRRQQARKALCTANFRSTCCRRFSWSAFTKAQKHKRAQGHIVASHQLEGSEQNRGDRQHWKHLHQRGHTSTKYSSFLPGAETTVHLHLLLRMRALVPWVLKQINHVRRGRNVALGRPY